MSSYTSEVMEPDNHAFVGNKTRGIIQVSIISGEVTLQARLHTDAPWLVLKSWTEDAIEELVLANQMRVICTGEAYVWLGEVR